MEDYAAKMLLKTDAALREYVTGHVQYREAAVLAALDELRRRDQPAPEEAALRPGLEAGAAAQRAIDEEIEAARKETVRPAADAPAAVADESSPALYSPITIVLFSIPFTFLAGGVLLGLNLWRLDRKRALLGLGLLLVAYFIAVLMVLKWALPIYGLSPWYGPLINLPPILAYVLWFWPRNISGISYRSRSWVPPLLVCFAFLYGMQKLNAYFMKQQPKAVQEQFERMIPK